MFIYQKSRLNMLNPTFGIQWNNVVVGLLIIIITACVFSFEPALADTLEGQLNKIDGLFSGKLKTIGISSATILSSIWAVARGNIKLAGVMVAIGVILGFYLDWIAGGMKIN
ncbi:hypothetical protein [Orientia tsutsugamushi]|uniref:TrbC/VIRB2 family protein n=2 Tax=Orientia tsutsugamushi TaxID=784 RepID=A0A2U3QZ52_ORITS|nr:hypothetical protein [Orientia tsutsugamushi]KJV70174.1 putative membrane protein [Orientia tsutsugamushi str. TA763]KJV72464.1 putative membrane protein [Orientia tsutsugamushi str. TA763]KJV73509.1 putative membrane protein [Orientia tsutsugamushi str. TA763]SPP23699.1 Uncharacterised protein [Orientia tsutsugamushi]SPP24280.1 Uncharacterised protein [Orientia tsutsugamushi]